MAETVRVYLDGQGLARNRDGVGSYTEYLLRGMLESAPKHFKFTAVLFADQRLITKLVSENSRFKYFYLPFPRRLYAVIYRLFPLPINAWLHEKPDVMWYPNFSCFPFIKNVKRVLTIHDFTYKHFPRMVEKRNLTYLKLVVPRSVKAANQIVAVSKHVGSEVKNFFNPSVPISVIYPPVRLSRTPSKPKVELPKQYILFVGTLEPRKNIPGLLRTYQQLPETIKQTYKLVIAGRKGWIEPSSFNKLQAAIETGNVVWVNGPSDDELSYLFRHARLFLYTSHYEGFGMPLKEAAQVGLPVIALDTPTSREAADSSTKFGKNSAELVDLVIKELSTKPPKHPVKHVSGASASQDANKLLDILYPH